MPGSPTPTPTPTPTPPGFSVWDIGGCCCCTGCAPCTLPTADLHASITWSGLSGSGTVAYQGNCVWSTPLGASGMIGLGTSGGIAYYASVKVSCASGCTYYWIAIWSFTGGAYHDADDYFYCTPGGCAGDPGTGNLIPIAPGSYSCSPLSIPLAAAGFSCTLTS
jgi:hypothetical protein